LSFLLASEVWSAGFWRYLQIEDFQTQVSELDRQLSHRTRELDVIRAELKAVKDFRRKRAQMQRELDEVLPALWTVTLYTDHRASEILYFSFCSEVYISELHAYRYFDFFGILFAL